MQIGRSEGREGLWGGTVASLILVSNPAIKFTIYEYLKRLNGAPQMSPSMAFLIGALASAIATIVTYPVQLVQTKARVASKSILSNFAKLVKSLTIFSKASRKPRKWSRPISCNCFATSSGR